MPIIFAAVCARATAAPTDYAGGQRFFAGVEKVGIGCCALDDAAYDAGLAQLAADLDTHGAHTLMPSEVTVAHIIARRN